MRERVLSSEELQELANILDTVRRDHAALPAGSRSDLPRPLKQESELALWIALSTLCRIGEILKSRWEHVDLVKGEWFLPAETTKTRVALMVYLSPFALRQFERLKLLGEDLEAIAGVGDPARSRIYSEVSRGLMPGGIEAWLPLFFPERTTATLADYLPEGSLLIALDALDAALAEDWRQIEERYERYHGDIERPLLKPAELYCSPERALQDIARFARVDLGVADDSVEALASGELLYLPPGHDIADLWTTAPARMLLLGGTPFTDGLLMWWNFIGRDKADIARYTRDWNEGRGFGEVRGYPGSPLVAPLPPWMNEGV